MSAPWIAQLEDHGPIYGPSQGDALPGVVILHGSEGPMAGWSHRFAVILAMHGLLALPFGYRTGDFWGIERIEGVDIRGVTDAVDALADHPRCRTAGLFGWSMGGNLALLVASIANDAERLPFVAAHAAPDVALAAFDIARFRAEGHGAPQADAPAAFHWPGHEDRLRPGTPIEIERYPGPVFLSTGDADTVVEPSNTLRLAERLRGAGNPADLFVAEGQGHALDFDTEPELWGRLTTFIGRAT